MDPSLEPHLSGLIYNILSVHLIYTVHIIAITIKIRLTVKFPLLKEPGFKLAVLVIHVRFTEWVNQKTLPFCLPWRSALYDWCACFSVSHMLMCGLDTYRKNQKLVCVCLFCLISFDSLQLLEAESCLKLRGVFFYLLCQAATVCLSLDSSQQAVLIVSGTYGWYVQIWHRNTMLCNDCRVCWRQWKCVTAPSAAGERQPEITLILDEDFLSLFRSILEQTTNINLVSGRIKALFTNMRSWSVWICLALWCIVFLQAVANFSQKMVIRYQRCLSLIQWMHKS